MKRVIADKTCGQDRESVDFICHFCIYAADELNVGGMDYEVVLTGDKEKYGIRTTAYFNPDTCQIVIYTQGRHPHDVIRSIAHEMTHMQQRKHDFFGRTHIKDVGGFFEDQANAVAGQIVKKFISYR